MGNPKVVRFPNGKMFFDYMPSKYYINWIPIYSEGARKKDTILKLVIIFCILGCNTTGRTNILYDEISVNFSLFILAILHD